MPANMIESFPSPVALRKTLSTRDVSLKSSADATTAPVSCFRHTFLRNVMKASLADARMDLWGEHEQLNDEDLIECVLPALAMAAWKTLDLRRSRLTARGIQALMHALATVNNSITDLCLGSMSLSGESLAVVAETLPKLKLLSLNLFDNQIGDPDIERLCKALSQCGTLRVLNLDNNNVTDAGAELLGYYIPWTPVSTLYLNNNNLTSIGADTLIDTFRRSCLTNVSLRGNLSVLSYTELRLKWAMSVCKSGHCKLCVALCSARLIPRLGASSTIGVLPIELMRRIVEALHDPESILGEELDCGSCDGSDYMENEDDSEEEDLDTPGFEEDQLATAAHHRRRWSSHTCSFSFEDFDEELDFDSA